MSESKQRRLSGLNVLFVILVIIIVWIIIATVYNSLQHNDNVSSEVDIAILGGGTAGCVLARRLSEKYPNKNIVLLDRGKDYRNDRNVYRIETALTVAYSEPYSEVLTPDFPGIVCSVAKMIGGASAHNFGLVVRGSNEFYQNNWQTQLNLSSEELNAINVRISSLMDVMPLPVSIDLLARLLPSLGVLFMKGIQEINQGIDVFSSCRTIKS